MKKLALIYLVCFISLTSVSFGQNWTQLSSGISVDLYSIKFTSTDTGYVVGGNGTILKTTNGGSTWLPQNSGTTAYLFSVFFMDENSGIIVGDSGIVLKTINAGTNWTRYATGTLETLWSVNFSSLANGVAVGTMGTIIKTTDGGLNWNTIPPISILGSTNYELNSVYFVDNFIGYAAGNYSLSGVVLKTNDGGNNWTKVVEGAYNGVSSVIFVNDSAGWISCGYWIGGPSTSVLGTSDFGATWNSEIANPPYSFKPSLFSSMFFSNDNVGYVGGTYWEVMTTLNGGVTWELQQTLSPAPTDPNSSINSIYFPNDTVGYATGDSGRIIKTINAGGVGVSELSDARNSFAIYPNPSNGRFTLSLPTNAVTLDRIEIYDILGNVLWSVERPTDNQLNIDLSGVQGGIYLVKIENKFGVIINKLIIQ